MDRTSLYVIFQEYSDSSSPVTNPLIISRNKIDEEIDSKYFGAFLEEIEFFRYEVIDRYYDANNLRAALYPYLLLEIEYRQYGEYPDIASAVRSSLIANGFEDIQQGNTTKSDETFLFHDIDVTNTIIGKAAMENGHIDIDGQRKKCHHVSVLFQKESLDKSLVKESILKTENGNKKINIVSSLKELYEWFSKNRLPQRIYVYNPKHGDAYHKAQALPNGKMAAQLETDEEATRCLLGKAIGIDTNSALWYYDHERKKFIYFENQREQRLAFHGYHLSPGDENYDNIDQEKLRQIEPVPED